MISVSIPGAVQSKCPTELDLPQNCSDSKSLKDASHALQTWRRVSACGTHLERRACKNKECLNSLQICDHIAISTAVFGAIISEAFDLTCFNYLYNLCITKLPVSLNVADDASFTAE